MENFSDNSQEIISVSEVNNRAKNLLEREMSRLWIEGEISSFTAHSSGHWYFTIKDKKASLSSVMWNSDNDKVLFKPQVGDKLIINGTVSLYSPTGRYQLNAKHIELAGEGALLRAYEQLKSQLEQEGLFQQESKKELPLIPKKIAVITSSDGAVLQDIINVLGRRAPSIELILIQSSVQGENSAPQICNALKKVASLGEIDAVIIARGGGSIEDLWAFNTEFVARSIHSLVVPVISAIGHETDFTIADFVADLRAPTPSAAAEILSQSHSNLEALLKTQESLLINAVSNNINSEVMTLNNLGKRIRHPGEKVRELFQRIDALETGVKSAIKNLIIVNKNRTKILSSNLLQFSPTNLLQQSNHRLESIGKRLSGETSKIINEKKSLLLGQVSTLEAVSPLAVLGRGYSIISKNDGSVITSDKDVSVGEEIVGKLKDGLIKAKVIKN